MRAAGGTGDETVIVTVNGKQEVVHTFPWYIRYFAKQVLENGATQLILSLTPNFTFQNGKVPEPNRFAGYIKLVSEELKIPFIDHYNYIDRNYEILGESYIKNIIVSQQTINILLLKELISILKYL